MIEAVDLAKAFGAVRALAGVSFAAADGEITGLLGANGAGKTTALRVLYTAIRPDSGQALVDGHDVVREATAVQQAIGVLPHAHGLYPRLTGREQVTYFGRLQGLSSAAIAESCAELFQLLDMSDFADRRTQGLSEGQRRKIAIARALVHRPKNVILDEPTNGLDVLATRAMREIIRGLKVQKRCVVFSSHVMQEVSALCDRVVVLARGQVVAQGTLAEIRQLTGKENIEDAFVALLGDDGSGGDAWNEDHRGQSVPRGSP